MSTGRRLFSNVAGLGTFKALADIVVLAMFVFLARHFGRDGLGEYSFAMAFTGFFGMLANFGFEHYAVREVARDPRREGAYFGTFTILGLLLCPLLVGVTALVAWACGFGRLRFLVILAIGAYQTLYFFSFVVLGRFRAHSRMTTVGVLELALRVFILGGTIGAALAGAPLPVVALVMPAATLLYIASAALLLARGPVPLVWRLDWKFLSGAWREIWPFGLTMLMYASYQKIDVLMIGLLRGEEEVGIYAAAFRPIFGYLALAGFCCNATYPVFSRLYVESRDAFVHGLERFSHYLLLVSAFAGVGVVCLGTPLMGLLYGSEFRESVPVFRVFGILLLLTTFNSLMDPVLGAANRQRLRLRLLCGSILFNVTLNLLLVPAYGYMGAVVATIVSEAALLLGLYGILKSGGLGFGLRGKGVRFLGMAGASIAAWALLRGAVGDIPSFLAGAAVFLGTGLLLRAIRRGDLTFLVDLLRRGDGGGVWETDPPIPRPTRTRDPG